MKIKSTLKAGAFVAQSVNRISGNVLGEVTCHCRDCQYVCGGAPAYVIAVPKKSIEMLRGEPARFENTAESGARRIRQFCPNCGTPLFAENSKYPRSCRSRSAVSTTSPSSRRRAQLWTGSAPPWHEIDPEVPAFTKGPESA